MHALKDTLNGIPWQSKVLPPLLRQTCLLPRFEALAVLSALRDACLCFPPESKITIYSDNFTTVAMFNSLRALPEYNCILKAAIDIFLKGKHQLQVLHIPGEQNEVADALSWAEFMRALDLQPLLTIQSFDPYQIIECQQSPPMLKPPWSTLGQDHISKKKKLQKSAI